jgi:multisubunit Na+/H+ antiporter MnhB subunit
MNRPQTKRLYRLIAGICIITFLVFGFRAVDELWDDSLGDYLTDQSDSKWRDHNIMTDREFDRILAEKGPSAAQEFRKSPHPDTRHYQAWYRAWQFKNVYRDWSWALTFGSMVLLSALVYRIVWFLGDRSFRYVRDGTDAPPQENSEEPNKS